MYHCRGINDLNPDYFGAVCFELQKLHFYIYSQHILISMSIGQICLYQVPIVSIFVKKMNQFTNQLVYNDQHTRLSLILYFKWANPDLFFVYFRSFQMCFILPNYFANVLLSNLYRKPYELAITVLSCFNSRSSKEKEDNTRLKLLMVIKCMSCNY